MAWDFENSRDRATGHYESTEGTEVADVAQKTDFESISLTSPRRVTGTHVYVDVANFNSILRSGRVDDAEMLRLLHLWNREVSKIVKDFDATKVHFQGPRLHALAYRPVGDPAWMVGKAVLLACACQAAVAAFNDVIGLVDNTWKVAAGLDHGIVTATRNGTKGDRELLFLGSAANEAAHLLGSAGIRITSEVETLLPTDFDTYVERAGDHRVVKMSASQVEEVAASQGWSWTYDATVKRLEEAVAKRPVGYIKPSTPTLKINKTDLRPSNTKRIDAVSLFADVDGFTQYIEEAAVADPDLVEAVRIFHTIRSEDRDSAVVDFDALRVQYQGDRMQALVYWPMSDEEALAVRAVHVAAALTSVASQVIPEVVDTDPETPLAIGMALGEVLVSKIGEHNNRDMVAVGASVAAAANIQGRLTGGQIGVDSALHNALPQWLRDEFAWSATAAAYVATDLTYETITDLAPSKEETKSSTGSHSVVTGGAAKAPLRPWSRR